MTERESQITKEYEIMASWEPRPEYQEAVLPLHFEYTFENGEKLIAEEENGEATIILKKDNEIVFNFSDLLPKGTKFVTPSFFKKHYEAAEKAGFSHDDPNWEGYDESLQEVGQYSNWECSPDGRYIVVGDWRRPQELLVLLHEIGHTHQDTKKREDLRQALEDIAGSRFDKTLAIPQIKRIKEWMIEESRLERDAWAYALHKFREIQNKVGVSLKSLFPTLGSLQSFINPRLRCHRRIFEFAVGHGYSNRNEPEILEEKKKFQEELLKHFDRLSR